MAIEKRIMTVGTELSGGKETRDVFLSHSKANATTALEVCQALEARGLGVWIAPRDIMPGSMWSEAIVDAIGRTRVMVLLFSGHADQSRQVAREVSEADEKQIPIIPVWIENVEPTGSLRFVLSGSHRFDAFDTPIHLHLDRLAQVIQSHIMASPNINGAKRKGDTEKTASQTGNSQLRKRGPGAAGRKAV